MRVIDAINPTLLKEAEELARRRQVSAATVIEEALQQYLDQTQHQSPLPHREAELPVAQSLRFRSPAVGGMSLGKLLEAAESDTGKGA